MYFFDTYALFEFVIGNESYEPYFDGKIYCTFLNLFELHQALLREFNKKTADYWIKNFDYVSLEITNEDIINASDFRWANKKRDLSSADCIGYVLAKRNKLKFLTGDKEFEPFENVEFVK